MSALEDDWRSGLDDVDATLIDEYQSGFPVAERPFRVVGAELGLDEDDALDRVSRLREQGIFRRFGAVLNPPVIGSSTLAAVQAPDDRFDEVAEIINGYQQVNHNYRRDHEWNMWFVVTAGSKETRDHILGEIEERTGCTVLNLPMLTDYYIDLEFPVVNTDRFARETQPTGVSPDERAESEANREQRESLSRTDVSATHISEDAKGNLSELEAKLLVEIQAGFPLSATPYRDVADAIDADVDDVLAAVRRLLDDGCIKRIGCVVNHVVTGFHNNCMVVWDVPDDELDERGVAVGELPYVTLCYHRPRRPEQDWSYNLFTMIHGREAEAVDEKIDELATEHLPFTHERLYSTETLKQTGAQYEELVAGDERDRGPTEESRPTASPRTMSDDGVKKPSDFGSADAPPVEEKPYKIIFEANKCFGAGKCAEVADNWEMDLASGLAKPKSYFFGEDELEENIRAAEVCPAKKERGVIHVIDRRTDEEIAPNPHGDGTLSVDW